MKGGDDIFLDYNGVKCVNYKGQIFTQTGNLRGDLTNIVELSKEYLLSLFYKIDTSKNIEISNKMDKNF